MPTVLRRGPYRFFFYANDRTEPRHIHVERDYRVAKFWLDPVRIQNYGGFSPLEIRNIQFIINRERSLLMEGWNEYFNQAER